MSSEIPSYENLSARIAKVERENRTMKRIFLAILILPLALLAMAQAPAQKPVQPPAQAAPQAAVPAPAQKAGQAPAQPAVPAPSQTLCAPNTGAFARVERSASVRSSPCHPPAATVPDVM